jgi:hypothetical protein
MHRTFLLVIALVTSLPIVVYAQDGPIGRILVLDLATRDTTFRGARVFAVAYDEKLEKDIRAVETRGARDTLLARFRTLDAGTRWTSGKGDRLLAFVLHDAGTVARLQFKEEPRRTRLASDLVTLSELALRIATAAPEAAPRGISVTEGTYTLKRPRANLTVGASLAATEQRREAPNCTVRMDPPAEAAASRPGTQVVVCLMNQAASAPAPAGDAAKTPAKSETSAEITLITGPSEHLFLSANAGSTSASQLKYDEESRSLQPRETPTGFLIGINYSVGDILTEPDSVGTWSREHLGYFLQGLYFGGAIQGSRRPFDQAGAILGFRYNPIPFLNRVVDFETVSPFVGAVWTKHDRVDDAGNRLGDRKYGSGDFVWGVSLNLDKALGWVGGGQD